MKHNILNYGELKVITDKEVYLLGEEVNISIINIGPVDLGGEPRLRIMHLTQGNVIVHDAPINELASMILINDSFHYVWNQLDPDGKQVHPGEFYIQFFFVCCGGISAQNHTTFKMQEEPIYIENIQGGLGISIIVRNIGLNNSYDVHYSIEVSGVILLGSETDGQIQIIPPQEKIILHHYIIGIGFSWISINVEDVSKIENCFIIGPYIYI